MLPAIDITFDIKTLERNLGAANVRKALRSGALAGQFEYLSRVRQGFEVGGYNPETGEPGFWKPRRIPTDAKGKPIKGRAKTKNGVVRRIRIGGKTLVNNGDYLRSVVASPMTETQGGVSGFVGTNIPYAKYHEQVGNPHDFIKYNATGKQAAFLRALGFAKVFKGTTITLPKRRVFVIPAKWRKEISAIIAEEATEALNGGS